MLKGTLIAESLPVGAELRADGLTMTRLYRQVRTDEVPGQPVTWTVIDFEAHDEQAGALAQSLAGVLGAEGGWYADFTVGSDHVVVFARKVFRYRRGDKAGRAQVTEYGLSVGVPPHQLDWPD